jgi:hypothetical protein
MCRRIPTRYPDCDAVAFRPRDRLAELAAAVDDAGLDPRTDAKNVERASYVVLYHTYTKMSICAHLIEDSSPIVESNDS